MAARLSCDGVPLGGALKSESNERVKKLHFSIVQLGFGGYEKHRRNKIW